MLSAMKQVEAKAVFSFSSACRQIRINHRINQEKVLIMIGYQPRQCVQPRVYCHVYRVWNRGVDYKYLWSNICEKFKGEKHIFLTIANSDQLKIHMITR